MTHTDAQVRDYARGVLTGYVSGKKEVTDGPLARNGNTATVWALVTIPDLDDAARQWAEANGKDPTP